MKTDFSSKTAEVIFTIRNEGPQYKVSNIGITSTAGLDSNKIYKELKLRKGRIFDVSKLRKDMNMIVEEAGNRGYAFAKVEPKFHKNDASRTIDIVYKVDLGSKVKINDVKISGNTKTKDRVVRRYVYLAPGDTFSLQDLKDSKCVNFKELDSLIKLRLSLDKSVEIE